MKKEINPRASTFDKVFIFISREFNDVDYAVAVVAALGHDIAHPGRSNSYFVGKNDNIVSPKMLTIIMGISRRSCGMINRFWKISTAQSFANCSKSESEALKTDIGCIMVLDVLRCRTGSNIFSNFDYSLFMTVRGRIIQLILATDMSLHYELMGRVKLRLGSPEFDPVNIFDDVW